MLISSDVHCVGETAGLRIPVAGWDAGSRPHWVLGGKALFSGRPRAVGIGSEAADARSEPTCLLAGAAAQTRLASLLPPPKGVEPPHPTSLAGIDNPPIIAGARPEQVQVEGAASR